MRKMFAVLVLVLALCVGAAFAEGFKPLAQEGFVTVQVPEMAPEFYEWPAQILGALEIDSQRALIVLQAVNPARNCMVLALFFKNGDKIHLVGMDVRYLDGTQDIIEDAGFKKNGVPLGKLTRQKSGMTMEDISRIFPKGVQI